MKHFKYKKLHNYKMLIPRMHHIDKIHFIGIGGSGMNSIARILVNQGYKISGSDLTKSEITKQLIEIGVKFFFGHHSNNINNVDLIVTSSAISHNNPEIIAAKKLCIPIIHRAEMLSELIRFKYSIVVAGTHGKTTTTAMISDIYTEAGLDPTFINGGLLKSSGTYSKLGLGNYLIAEADESDSSFLFLRPIVIIITNIDIDHIEMYHGNFKKLKKAFIDFLHNLPFYGYAVLCIDDPIIREIIPKINRKIITYGFSNKADLHISNFNQKIGFSRFTVNYKNEVIFNIKLNTIGYFNALNATAAIAAAKEEGISNSNILKSISQFKGIYRRLDNFGYYNLVDINGKIGRVMMIDDYGHHPTEINSIIETVRVVWPNKRLVMVFQPHRYSRTRDLYRNFIDTLCKVDILVILDIYPAGEKPIPGINSNLLCQEIRKIGKVNPILSSSNVDILFNILSSILEDGDLILMQGAGSIGNITKKLDNSKFKLKDKQ